MDNGRMSTMILSFSPPTGDDLKRCRESLEHLGPEEVWSRLNRTTTLDPGEMVEICDPPLPTR